MDILTKPTLIINNGELCLMVLSDNELLNIINTIIMLENLYITHKKISTYSKKY